MLRRERCLLHLGLDSSCGFFFLRCIFRNCWKGREQWDCEPCFLFTNASCSEDQVRQLLLFFVCVFIFDCDLSFFPLKHVRPTQLQHLLLHTCGPVQPSPAQGELCVWDIKLDGALILCYSWIDVTCCTSGTSCPSYWHFQQRIAIMGTLRDNWNKMLLPELQQCSPALLHQRAISSPQWLPAGSKLGYNKLSSLSTTP